MEKIDTKKLFQITEAAHACGLSRSTLMRLEEKGLLKPAYIAPDSGRRYYDNHNVARILQIEKFKAMGFGTEEIAGYFVRGGEAEGLLAVLEERLHSLQRSVEEMRLRATESDQFSVQMVTLPAVTCCIQWHVGHTFAERYDAMYDFYSQCIREGCVLSDEPLFVIINSYTTGLAPSVLGYMLHLLVAEKYGGKVTWDELGLPVTETGLALPCGATGRWFSE